MSQSIPFQKELVFQQIETAINSLSLPKTPEGLYDSITYILSIGGKRIRPYACLLACNACGKPYQLAFDHALVLEMFHNFTLMHDDIMDEADRRRGQPTTHVKYGNPTAILGGDAMLVKTYSMLCSVDNASNFLAVFNRMALDVCEGQQMDMNNQFSREVSLADYIEMIRLKTAVLLGTALEMGAMAAGVDESTTKALYDFGVDLGIAFQIKDDYLDCYGSESFGKKIGGDILVNKKTWLYISAKEKAGETDKMKLLALENEQDETKKVSDTLGIFNRLNIPKECIDEMNRYYQKCLGHLENANLPEDGKRQLSEFAYDLWNRTN